MNSQLIDDITMLIMHLKVALALIQGPVLQSIINLKKLLDKDKLSLEPLKSSVAIFC